MAASMSVGPLAERLARFIAEGPRAVIGAAQKHQALMWEVTRARLEGESADTKAIT